MSGDAQVPTVELFGTSMTALVQAIPVVSARTGRDVVVIGGLAVICRLGRPYRATNDLDVANRRADGEPAQLELLLASGVRPCGVSGVLVPTPSGDVQVDVLEVSDAELADLPDDPTDRLHVLSHAWAVATATPIVIRATGTGGLTTAVGEPGPLIAMKLQSLMNRGSAKEATDLLDIVNLTLDRRAGRVALTQLAGADARLRADAARHAARWFVERLDRSTRLVRGIPEGRDIEPDDLKLVGELLLGTL